MTGHGGFSAALLAILRVWARLSDLLNVSHVCALFLVIAHPSVSGLARGECHLYTVNSSDDTEDHGIGT